MDQSKSTRLISVLNWVAVFILVILPFHEFLTTWIGSNLGHLTAWRIWYEIVIILCIPFIFYLVSKKTLLKKWLTQDWMIRLIVVYALLTIISGIWAYKTHRVNASALGDGLLIDLRFLAFFGVTAVLSHYSDFIKSHWRQILIIPSIVVVGFGIIQLFLPYNFLSHFGYGPSTIPAYETVNSNLNYIRIQSTLRGADPLGAYLLLTIPALLICIRPRRWPRIIAILASLIVLFFTYSRSAYIGLALTTLLLIYWLWIKPSWRRKYLSAAASVALVTLIGLLVLRYNHVAQNVIFHTSSNSKVATSSNSVRLSAWRGGLNDLIHHPLGGGTGTAGPASVHNSHPAKIAENYYIQIGQEVGWVGLALFVSINVIVGIRLYKRRADPFAALLLASLIGISLINMFSHEWADDTLSMIWWGLAGVALAPGIIKPEKHKQKHQSNETRKKTLSPA